MTVPVRSSSQIGAAAAAQRTQSGPSLLARFDRLPSWPHPRPVLWLIGAGYFFGFFDILTIGVALPKIAEQFHVSTRVAAVSITTSLVGYVVGALVIGVLSDRFGRRLGLYLSLGCFSIGSLLSALSPDMIFLDAARFLTGIGIGAEIAVVSTYVGELAPRAVRGRMAAKAGLFAVTSQAVVPLLARVLVPDVNGGWRILFAIGALGGVVTLVLRLRYDLPVTLPRLVVTGHLSEAQAVVEAAEVDARRSGRELPPPVEIDHGLEMTTGGSGLAATTTALLAAPFRRRLLLMLTVWFVFYIGDYGWLTLAPTLLSEKGFGLSQSLTFLTVAGVGLIVGAMLGTAVNDRLERRYTAGIALAVWAATMGVIGVFPHGPVVMAMGFLANAMVGLVIFLLYIYTAESFPTAGRSTGVALTDGLGHIGGASAPWFVFSAFDIAGFAGSFVMMGICGVIAALLLQTGVRT